MIYSDRERYFVMLKVVDKAERQGGDSVEMPSSDSEHSRSMRRQHDRRELAEKIRRYESGEKGKLNAIFPGSLRHWLDHCYNLGDCFTINVFTTSSL